MMPLHQERLDVEVFLKVMLLFHTLAREALHHLLRSRCLAAVNITPAQHAGGPGFNPQRVQFDLIGHRTLGRETFKRKVQS